MTGIPEGISTALVHMDSPVSFIGDAGRLHVTIKPSVPLVWAATGTPLGNFLDTMKLDSGVPLEVYLPHTDQSGFLDGNGNSITGWYYTVKVIYEKDGQRVPFPTRDFQVLTGQDEVDLALIPSGEASPVPEIAPILPVTSIAGLTGEVTVAELDTILGAQSAITQKFDKALTAAPLMNTAALAATATPKWIGA